MVYLKQGRLDPALLNPLSSVFAWPVSSFASARAIFGPQDAQVWHFFSLFSILLFISLVVTSLEKKY